MDSFTAELYRATHQGNPGDAEFYRDFAKDASRVVELGSGAGRITARLADAAASVTGVELEPHLLEFARGSNRRENVTFQRADMRSYESKDTFDCAVIPYCGVYCLLSESEVEACFSSVAGCMSPGARFAFDSYAMDEMHLNLEHADGMDAIDHVLDIEVGELTAQVFEQSEWNRAAQTMSVRYEYRLSSGEVREVRLEHRYLLMHQVQGLLSRTGFEDVQVMGGFDGATYDRESEHWVVTARRPER